MRRWTINTIKAEVEKHGYTCVSSVYQPTEKLEMKCPEGHFYNVSWPKFYSAKRRCPHCAGQVSPTEAFIKRALAADGYSWVSGEYINNKTKIDVLCPKGHQYKVTWNAFHRGYRCDQCCPYRFSKKTVNDLSLFAHGRGYKLVGDYKASKEKVALQCPHGKIYEPRWVDFQSGHGCTCEKSQAQRDLAASISSLGLVVRENVRDVIAPKELDIVLPEFGLAIEYCGLLWHSNKYRSSTRFHRDKRELALAAGYELFTIWEDEWLNRKEVLLSMIKVKTGLAKRVFARNLVVEFDLPPSMVVAFLDKNHLQGASRRHKHSVALCTKDGKIMQVITLASHHRKGGILVLDRMASILDTVIVGGATRLMSALGERLPGTKVVTFADLRYTSGKIYEQLGFISEARLSPDYCYVTSAGHRRFSKQSMRKQKTEDSSISESKLRSKDGYYKLFDCGKIRYSIVL